MASYPPPAQPLQNITGSSFSTSAFFNTSEFLTVKKADERYFKTTGGVITGATTINNLLTSTIFRFLTDPINGAALTSNADGIASWTVLNHNTLAGYVSNQHINWTDTTSNLLTTGTVTTPSIIMGSSGQQFNIFTSFGDLFISPGNNGDISGARYRMDVKDIDSSNTSDVSNYFYGRTAIYDSVLETPGGADGLLSIRSTMFPFSVYRKTNNTSLNLLQLRSDWSSTDNAVCSINARGNMTIAGTLTQNSDERIKKNIKDVNTSEMLDLLCNLKVKKYQWIDEKNDKIGLLAQDVQKYMYELVSVCEGVKRNDIDNILGIDYIGLIPYLIASIQELQTRLDLFVLQKDQVYNIKSIFSKKRSSV